MKTIVLLGFFVIGQYLLTSQQNRKKPFTITPLRTIVLKTVVLLTFCLKLNLFCFIPVDSQPYVKIHLSFDLFYKEPYVFCLVVIYL